jgi:hypothetical protein
MDALKNEPAGSTLLFEQKKVAVFQNKVYPSSAEAKQAPFSAVRLVQSDHTGFCYNQSFDDALMVYDTNYNNDQSNSGIFHEHLLNVANILMGHGIKGKKVVEIGCGKGDFLEMIRPHSAEAIGFDPAYTGDSPYIVKDLFSRKYSIGAEVIILRHTMEHINNPHSFIMDIAAANEGKGEIYIEVPTIDWIIRKNAFWDVFYEHCNYFSAQSLGAMFDGAETGHLFGDQYIYCYASLEKLRKVIPQQKFTPYDTSGFRANFDHWSGTVRNAGRSAVWGAGAKGSTFLNLMDPEGKHVTCVVDINPVKQGRYIGLTGHPVIPPSQLPAMNPQSIFIMNENYRAEIEKTVSGLGLRNVNIYTL